MTAVEQREPARRRRMPAARRRESILAAAAAVFAADGYRAARVSDIAARVGVSEPVVFQHFGSKSALFTAVLERAAGQARATVEGGAGHGTAGELLAHVIGHAAGGHRHPGHDPAGDAGTAPGGLFAAAVALAADPAVPEARDPVLRTLAGHLAGIIGRGQRDGSVRADIGPEPAAWLLLSLLAAGPLRAAAMPPAVEPALSELVGRLLSPAGRDLARPERPVNPEETRAG